jgi:heat shock protein HslJ
MLQNIRSYELKKENETKFSKITSIQKACEDVSLESQFLGILPAADHYSISGNQLLLSKGKAGVVAKFELKTR